MNVARRPAFGSIAVIGLGLIGSSLARAVKQKRLADEIRGVDRSAATRRKARAIGFVDSVHTSPAAAVRGADLVVFCTPLGAYAELAAAIGPALKPGAIVSDVGSAKLSAIRDIGVNLPEGVHFVPGHPVAGTEHSGPEAGFAELFEERYCILTPPAGTDRGAIEKVAELWRRLGSRIETMDAAHHDRVLAITSHLPHLIAYTIVGTASDLEEHLRKEDADKQDIVRTREVIRYSAGGFRDFTRIAGSDPVMWRDVMLNNQDAVLEMLGRFTEDLARLQRAVRMGEAETLYGLFSRTREIRRGVIEMGQAGLFFPGEKDGEGKK